MKRLRLTSEVLEFLVAVLAWVGLAILGNWLFGMAELWRAFAGAGIAGFTWGWLVGSHPMRKLRRDWVTKLEKKHPDWLPALKRLENEGR